MYCGVMEEWNNTMIEDSNITFGELATLSSLRSVRKLCFIILITSYPYDAMNHQIRYVLASNSCSLGSKYVIMEQPVLAQS